MTEKKTLRQAILDANNAVEKATKERNELLKTALEKNVSLRPLAKMLGVATNTVAKWAEKDTASGKTPDEILDEEFTPAEK